jgi:hypothetical protein
LDLVYDPSRKIFRHPRQRFPDPREPVLYPLDAPDDRVLFETAVLLARYPYRLPSGGFDVPVHGSFRRRTSGSSVPGPHGRTPAPRWKWLGADGVSWRLLAEISDLRGVDHAKEFHPEDDAWAHTLETFAIGKLSDLRLSLGLLLYDAGETPFSGLPKDAGSTGTARSGRA